MSSFDPERIEALIEQAGAACLCTENGRVSGVTYRERWQLPDGRFLDVTRDTGVGHRQIVEYAIRTWRARTWQTDR
jgi:hypothetical protein